MTSGISNTVAQGASTDPNDLWNTFEQDLANYGIDLNSFDALKAKLLELLAELKKMKDPGQAFNLCMSQILPNIESQSQAQSLVLSDAMNMNTDIRDFESSALADLNAGQDMTPAKFSDMISDLFDAKLAIQQANAANPNSPPFGTAGQDIIDQINDFASQMKPGSTIEDVFMHIDDYFKYFQAGMTPSGPPEPVPPSPNPPNPNPLPGWTPMFSAMSQDLGNVNQYSTSLAAQTQVKVQYQNQLDTQMLTVYKAMLKTASDMMAQINKNGIN